MTNSDITNVAVTCACPTSCKAIKQANPAATSGSSTIDPDGAGAKASLSVYCDMTTDGGGYKFYKMTGGISTFKRTDANSCQALGLEIIVPRTAAHLQSLYAYLGGDMSFLQTIPGVYGTKGGVNYSTCPMNDNATCSAVKTDWKGIDGGHWFVSSRTNITEPNSDYTPDCWLGYNSVRHRQPGIHLVQRRQLRLPDGVELHLLGQREERRDRPRAGPPPSRAQRARRSRPSPTRATVRRTARAGTSRTVRVTRARRSRSSRRRVSGRAAAASLRRTPCSAIRAAVRPSASTSKRPANEAARHASPGRP